MQTSWEYRKTPIPIASFWLWVKNGNGAITFTQDYDNQVLVRIDRIYFSNQGLDCKSAATITGSKGNGEIRLKSDWPSDHWAVLAEFELN
jgi:hypothetical protein